VNRRRIYDPHDKSKTKAKEMLLPVYPNFRMTQFP